MKRLFCTLLCTIVCLSCSLTAFAGGLTTQNENSVSTANISSTATSLQTRSVAPLPSGLSVGDTYILKSKASPTSTDYMLNVYAGYDSDGTNICLWEKDGSPEQRFKIVSSSNGYKLEALCATRRVLDAYRNPSNQLVSGCNADIWTANDDEAQNLVISGNSSGYTICLASNPTLALTANSIEEQGNVTFSTLTNANNQKWLFVRPNDVLSRSPNEDAQNKTKWCWAASAKMVAIHNGGLNPEIDSTAQLLTDTSGLHYPFYGEGTTNGTRRYYADGVQYAIVKHIHGKDENKTGNTVDAKNALKYVSARSVTAGSVGNAEDELTDEAIADIRNDLQQGKYVIGCIRGRNGEDPHSIVLTSYSNNIYHYFDPYTGSPNQATTEELFEEFTATYSGGCYGSVTWYQYCR